MKRWLFLIHRWLGIVACLFMFLWFVSGVVMMYVGYPKLTSAQRLMRLPDLNTGHCCILVAQAVRVLPLDVQPTSITLTSAGARPQYQFGVGKKIFAVDAISGAPITQVTAADAMAVAQAFMLQAAPYYLDRIDEDAWTHTRRLDPHRPLHRVQMDDAAQTLVYVSGVTGEVVRQAMRTERVWNYVGAWLHWLYAFRGGPLDGAWNNIVVYLSLSGVMVALSGSVIGIWQDVSMAQLMQAAATLSEAPIASAELLQREDAYYYGRAVHTMMGGMQHPLPVWRIRYADAAQTWVYIDPVTGVLLGKLDRTQRVKRWLFAFLHSWDLPVLLASRPLWDIALILLSMGGLALSATGVVMGVRRLRR